MATSQADSANHPHNNRSNEDEYVRLVVQHQGLLFAYLRTIFVAQRMPRKFCKRHASFFRAKRKQFTMGTNFVNWATTILNMQSVSFFGIANTSREY